MIIEGILNVLKVLLFTVFGWINLPAVPDNITNGIDSFFDLIFNNLTLLGFFIRPITLSISIPVLLIILNFERIYHLTMWILKKIPMLGIK